MKTDAEKARDKDNCDFYGAKIIDKRVNFMK